MSKLVVGNVVVTFTDTLVEWTSGMMVDANGAPNCCGPNNTGLDYTSDAGHDGDWYGVVTDTGDELGKPLLQGPHDPFPGFYISTTALSDHSKRTSDPARYVDSTKVPYISVPPELIRVCGVRKADVALVSCGDRSWPAIVADVGPRGHIGEGSIALADALRIASSPRHGGVSHGVVYKVFKGSSQGWPRDVKAIISQVAQLVGSF